MEVILNRCLARLELETETAAPPKQSARHIVYQMVKNDEKLADRILRRMRKIGPVSKMSPEEIKKNARSILRKMNSKKKDATQKTTKTTLKPRSARKVTKPQDTNTHTNTNTEEPKKSSSIVKDFFEGIKEGYNDARAEKVAKDAANKILKTDDKKKAKSMLKHILKSVLRNTSSRLKTFFKEGK